jgi:hypothetical protein
MTKDEMRAFLAQAVPAAIADGRAYVVRRPAGKSVRVSPNEQVQTKPVRPMRMFPRQGVMGAGFKIPTFKPLQGVDPDHVPYPNNIKPDSTPFFCVRCDCDGKDCTC